MKTSSGLRWPLWSKSSGVPWCAKKHTTAIKQFLPFFGKRGTFSLAYCLMTSQILLLILSSGLNTGNEYSVSQASTVSGAAATRRAVLRWAAGQHLWEPPPNRQNIFDDLFLEHSVFRLQSDSSSFLSAIPARDQ